MAQVSIWIHSTSKINMIITNYKIKALYKVTTMSLGDKKFAFFFVIKYSQESTTKKLDLNGKYHNT